MFKSTAFTVGFFVAVVAAPRTWACSFCLPDLNESLLNRVDSAGAAVMAELIRLPDPNEKHPVSSYRVTVVLKGDANQGESIDVPLDVRSPLGSVHLFFGDTTTDVWQNPRGVSREARSFLELASKLPAIDDESSLDDRTQRLAFMLPYLISKDGQIANSVYGEFAAAPDAAVKQLRPILNHRKLKAWIELEPVSRKHRRLMYVLLGVCGTEEDTEFVKAALDDRMQSEEFFELDAIIATYLTLSGDEGLDEIDRRLLKPTEVSQEARRATAIALRFHVDNGTVIKKERLIASCRLLLTDPNSADYVIADLVRWKDWDSLDAVLKLRSQAEENRWLEQPIREYLQACPLPAARMAVAASNP